MRKVFGVGVNKTGTTTLGACLTQLGRRRVGFRRPPLVDYLAGNPAPAFEIADEFDAFDDWPWALMYRELDERYPGSAFILTLRASPDIWLASLKEHSTRTNPDLHARSLIYGHAYPHGFEREHLDFYHRHADAARAYFGNRLLELTWENGDGWEKLCDFLGEPVPDVPLPHVNRGATSKVDPAFREENQRRIERQLASLSDAQRNS